VRYTCCMITLIALSFFRCLVTERDACENYEGCEEPTPALSFALLACTADTSHCTDATYLQKARETEKQCFDNFAVICAISVNQYKRVMDKSTRTGSGGIGSPI